MPTFSSKHKSRESLFSIKSFHDGYNEEKNPNYLTLNELSECKNLRYVIAKASSGEQKVVLKKRRGTTIISNSALPAAADVRACTYYIAKTKYILATSAKLYYLDGSYDPQEIGNLDGVPTFTEFNGKLIIHDTGQTKYYDGTNFGTINKSFADEVIETGDNSETEFTGTMTNIPVEPSSLDITFTDTTTKTISDDGTGRLTGNVSSTWTGTITGAADNGAGLIRITDTGHPYATSDEINIKSVVGTTEANNSSSNPTWTITKIDANTYDLQGSTFAHAWVSGGTSSKNTIIYSTGVYVFKCDGAPDTSTNVTADYEQTDGAPKSKAGLVRASRLYTWGDSDYPSRITYTAVNDEVATDTSTDGGYLDVDPNDGYQLLGALNFETTLLLLKQNSIHRIDDYPGDTTFKVEKLTDDIGCVAHRTPLFEGEVISFLSYEGWVAMHPSERFGDIQKGLELSKNFHSNAVKHANAGAFAAYNRVDQELWLSLSTNGVDNYLDYFYVVNLGTGGQVSQYKFAFGYSCFSYVHGEMLIGGVDGNLYKLDTTDYIFTDNDVDFSDDCHMRSGFTDWDLPNNYKHNKKINVYLSGNAGISANLVLYRNDNSTAYSTTAISLDSTWGTIYDEGPGILIYDGDMLIGSTSSNMSLRNKFNYRTLMYGIDSISGNLGVEIYGVDFKTAIIGDK